MMDNGPNLDSEASLLRYFGLAPDAGPQSIQFLRNLIQKQRKILELAGKPNTTAARSAAMIFLQQQYRLTIKYPLVVVILGTYS